MRLLPSDDALEAAQALRSMLHKLAPGPVGSRVLHEDHALVEESIIAGGWHRLGMPESADGAGMDLVDLVTVAETWGHAFIASPFVMALLLGRWGLRPETRPDSTRLPTLAVPGHPIAPAVAPYGDAHPVVETLGPDGGHVIARPLPEPAEEQAGLARWAASMPLRFLDRPTGGLPDEALPELLTLGCAELVGVVAAALEAAAAYATQRVQFDQPIAEFQAVRHHLADMARDVEVARTGVICMANEPERVDRVLTVLRRSLMRTLSTSVQLHGGFGFTWEAGLHHYLRHAMAWSLIFDGCRAAATAESEDSRWARS